MTEKIDWQAEDKKYIWHPAMQMKDNEVFPPVVIDHAKGVYLYDTEGKPYLDIISSWWCNLLGHCNPEINEALKRQINTLEHVIFTNFSHKPAIELSRELAELLPKGLTKFTYHDNGSSAVEAAMKMAYQYHNQTGHPERQKFMCLDSSYHGETIGALSVGSMDDYAGIFHPLLMDNIHFKGLDCYRCPYGKTRETCNIECFESAEEAFEKFGKETAACIVEPVLQGAAGMRMYPPAYLTKLRALCDKYGVLLIDDEIAAGFGRTGKLFAWEHAGVEPDIMCIGKALTGGYMTLSAVLASNQIADTISNHAPKAFMHGPTFMGNPLACAVACASVRLLLDSGWAENVKRIEAQLKEELAPARKFPQVADVRILGAIGVIQTERSVSMAYMQRRFVEEGIWVRPFGKLVYLMPPFIISPEQLSKLTSGVLKIVREM